MLFVNLSEISCANYSIIIIYYEVFLYFFQNQFFIKIVFFALWRKKIRTHLVKSVISGILQGLIKIYKKCIEVIFFFTPKLQCSYIMVLVDNA